MDLLNLTVGLLMIGLGFLVKSAPDLIAGYNTMSKDKKKNVDISGLSTFMRNGFITIGISMIIGYYLFKWVGFTMIANSMIFLITLFGTAILVIHAQRFDHNKKNQTKLTYFIIGLVILFVFGLMTYGFIPAKVIYSHDKIQFSGMYGFDMNTGEIEYVEITEKLPTIKKRTNGFSFGTIHKGFFNLDKIGKSRLLVHSETAPYLIISKKNGDKIIINFNDKTETEKLYNKIKILMDE